MANDWKEKLKQLRNLSADRSHPATTEQERTKDIPLAISQGGAPLKTAPSLQNEGSHAARKPSLRPGMNYESLIAANEVLSQDNQRLAVEILHLQKELVALQQGCNTLTQELQGKDSELEDLKNTYSMLPKGRELAEVLATINGIDVKEAALERLTKDLDRRQRRIDQNEAQLARLPSLDQELDNVHKEKKELDALAMSLDDQKDALDEALANYKLKLQKVKDREIAVRAMELDIQQHKLLERQVKKLSKKNDVSETEITRLVSLVENLENHRKDLRTELRASRARITDQESQIRELSNDLLNAPKGEFFVRSIETVHWLTSQFMNPQRHSIPRDVLLIGEGPWDLETFADLLVERKFRVGDQWTNPRCEIVLVGRDNWDPEQIEAQISVRDGKTLRVYPQELFVAYMILGVDPFELASVEELLLFAQDHALMEHLLEQHFPWPDSSYQLDGPANIGDSLDSEDGSSPMFKLGYSVAQNRGLSNLERRSALEKTLAAEDLPWCISDEYMEEWGCRQSAARLRRMAWHIHLMTKRHRQHRQAVEKWADDLDWLRSEKYRPIHRFRWPV